MVYSQILLKAPGRVAQLFRVLTQYGKTASSVPSQGALNAWITGTANSVSLSDSLPPSLSLNTIKNIFNIYGEKEKSRRGDHGKRGKQKNTSIRHREGKGRNTGKGKKGRKEKEEKKVLTYTSKINSTHSVAKGF